ncbi:MAG: GNAT family N-acetyltransferase [Bryobacteraceae bacterium]
MRIVYRLAQSEEDYEKLRRLNHATFAEELGQHERREDGRLQDRFEGKSRYLLAMDGEHLAAMVCWSAERPFSVESRLADPGILDTLPQPLCEVRLLAVERSYRNTTVFAGLLARLLSELRAAGAATVLISGVEERVGMYERMGFRALGPAVPQGAARFVPMALRLDGLPERIEKEAEKVQRRIS